MGTVGDRLDRVRIETTSPDGQITGTLRPPAGMTIAFSYDRYRHYTERELEQQLTALVELLWSDYRDARQAAAAKAGDEPEDAESRRYHDERDETDFEGMSNGHNVYISGTGLLTWHVVIRDGSLTTLDESAFTTEFASAYSAVMRDCRAKLNRLRDKHSLH